MRTFLAIEIESFLKDNLKKTQKRINKSNSAKIKFVETENIHLTLKFFGDINERKQNQIIKIINKTIANYKPYDIKLAKTGAFPNINRPRVIWAGIKDKDKNTINLIKQLDEQFNKIGFKKEKDYVPHITIGRVKKVTDKEELTNTLRKLNDEYYGKMTVSEIKLKSSELTPDGPIYTTIKEFDL